MTEAFYLSFFLQNKLLPNQANKEEFITRQTFWFAFGKNKWSEELDAILFNINAINAAEVILFFHSKQWELIQITDFFVLCHEQIIFRWYQFQLNRRLIASAAGVILTSIGPFRKYEELQKSSSISPDNQDK